MKILVTGGNGFIGRWLVEKLVERGHQVVVVDIRESDNNQIKFYKKDICDKDLLEIFESERPEIVFHLAANSMLRKSIEDPIYDARNNILGTINVLECSRKCAVKKIIYTSTGGARVGEPEYLPVDEKHGVNPLSPYGISKHSAEHYVQMYGKVYGLDYFIFCFGNVYGPRDDPKTNRVIPVFISKILSGERPLVFGDGLSARDFIYVEDLADFMAEKFNRKSGHKLFYLASGEETRINEIYNMLKEISGFKEEAIHTDAIKGEVKEIVLDIALAKRELDWYPKTSLREGLKKTWEWFR